MTSSTEAVLVRTHSRKSIYLVLGSTVFAAVGQILMKFGTGYHMPAFDLHATATWMPFVLALLGNYPLLLGYFVQSFNALLLILALKNGELSILFPIISLTYVWVAVASIYFFHDQANLWKSVGIALIIGGVALLGRASSRS
jgi:multidrug transporter EmrE-like cation transporter